MPSRVAKFSTTFAAAYIESQGVLGWITVDERFDEEGASGATLNRPGLQRLLGLVRGHGVDQVVVHRFDRLARSLIGTVRLLEEFRKHRVSLFIVTAPELGSTAHDHLIFNILASFAEFEREMIASRIADARAALKAKGRRVAGAVPYGYDGDPRTKQLVVNPKEALAVRLMFGAASEGKLPLVIPKEANARGWLTKAGGLWIARRVIATLRNPVHLGLTAALLDPATTNRSWRSNYSIPPRSGSNRDGPDSPATDSRSSGH